MQKKIGEWLSRKDNFCGKFSFLRVASEQWKKERPILVRNYKLLLMCILFQWVHNLATNLARFLHIPQRPLYDLGFALIPSIDSNFEFICDVVFCLCILMTIIVWLSPFFTTKHSISSVGMLSRFLSVLVLVQSLRIVTFVMTDLPGPSPRCRPDHPWYNQPRTMTDILWRSCVGFLSHGCGELVFSSRMLIVVLCMMTIARYGRRKSLTVYAVALSAVYGLLMISARREYSLSIFMAWYTVPLVWVVYGSNFPDELTEMPTREVPV
mmetsp:Transcript_24328/g.36501  ORF Transcript_24328/g.36501 Transcript_24328/m.36501 type:complete len:267 (+) Transcript_24328:128-928(+)